MRIRVVRILKARRFADEVRANVDVQQVGKRTVVCPLLTALEKFFSFWSASTFSTFFKSIFCCYKLPNESGFCGIY